MKYFLDTSACRFLGKQLIEYSKQMPLFVSSLTYVEILSHLHEVPSEIDLNKQLIKAIYESATTDWRFPEQLLAESYDGVHFIEERDISLREIIYAIVNGASDQNLFNVGEKFNLPFFAEYDKFLSDILKVRNHKEVIKMQRESYDREREGGGIFTEKELTLSYSALMGLFNSKYFILNYSISIEVFAEMMLRMMGIEESDRNIEKMYNSYNGKAKMFMMAYSFNGISRMSNHEESSRNDFIDLLHFLYLNQDEKIISGDKLILDLANKLVPGAGINVRTIPINPRQL